MPEIVSSTVWGIAPWSDELLKISGDVDRGRRPVADLETQLLKDFNDYEQVLQDAAIDFRGDSWSGNSHDYLRDIVQASGGFASGINQAPVTRWFDTNTFYRRPTLQSQPHFYGTDEHPNHSGNAFFQPTFLSPYTFARLINRSSGINLTEADGFVGRLYDEVLDEAAERGVQHVLLHEPLAAYNQIDRTERSRLQKLVGRLAANHHALDVGVYFSFGDASEVIRTFADDDRITALGCDLQKTPYTQLPWLPNQRFLAGLIDGANTLLADDDEALLELAQVGVVTGSPELSLTHAIDLEHVPRSAATAKIQQIGRLAAKYKEEYE